MDLWIFLGSLHPKLVHFPLVLLPAGLLFDLVGLRLKSERCHWAGRALTVAGTVCLLAAFICGIYAEVWAGRAGIPHEQIELHELFANVASWGFVVLAAWRLFIDGSRRRAMGAYVAIGLGWYALLAIAGYLGGQLVYEYGAGVVGARANSGLSLHDLNTLATRQTDLNLVYSEMMHHIFGWLTLALAITLLVDALFPKHAAKLRWVGPLLLLLGGIFLFFFADLDLYKLTDLRQFKDREVQLHKALAIIMTVVGIVGLRRLKTRAVKQQAAPPEPGAKSGAVPGGASVQARLIAVMALIGGGMLFTHVHTVAPYANVAAGVYLAHIVMGSVALGIGATRLLADALPRWRRGLALLFAVLMCTEALLLITYNEGPPWYFGIGRYNRWGPHGGTIAPYGDVRAELTFDNDQQKLDVYILDRFADTPVSVQAQELDVLLSRGYQETAIRVRAVKGEQPPGGGHDHFTADVPFLKNVPAFCARMALPMPGGGLKMSSFDPWVTPVIAAVPPNELAMFRCPMHEGIRAAVGGTCSLCQMPLEEIDRTPRADLHDPEFELRLATPVIGGDENRRMLAFTPMHKSELYRTLLEIHEHPLHLIIVSEDLKFFDHVHPVTQPDGSLTLDYTFPGPGRYLLFADITPATARNQVFRLPVTIGSPTGPGAEANILKPSAARAMVVEQEPTIVAEMIPTPRTMAAGPHTQLLVRMARNGQPVTDIEPFIGAMGHCVIISEDTKTYLHCHPEQLATPQKTDRGGPDVVFHTRFPRPGRYKVWAQFNRAGRMLIVERVLEVGEPILPQWLMGIVFDE